MEIDGMLAVELQDSLLSENGEAIRMSTSAKTRIAYAGIGNCLELLSSYRAKLQ